MRRFAGATGYLQVDYLILNNPFLEPYELNAGTLQGTISTLAK